MTNSNNGQSEGGENTNNNGDKNSSTINAAKEFLLVDYERFGSSFWHNEESGEKRVNFFITLVTAVIAALITLFEVVADGSVAEAEQGYVRLIVILAVFGLLGFGAMTFLRMVKRNMVTDQYKETMDLIRGKLIKSYDPFPEGGDPPNLPGGLADIVAVINGALIIFLIYLANVDLVEARSVPILHDYPAVTAFVIGALAIVAQVYWARSGRKSARSTFRSALERANKEDTAALDGTA